MPDDYRYSFSLSPFARAMENLGKYVTGQLPGTSFSAIYDEAKRLPEAMKAAGLYSMTGNRGYMRPELWFNLAAEGVGGGYPGRARGPNELGQIRAFHGSGVRGLKKFSNEFIGSGQGAQSFGWGHYFSDLDEVARTYPGNATPWRKFTHKGSIYKQTQPERLFNKGFTKNNKTISREQYNKAFDEFRKDNFTLYETTLHSGKTPEQYDYLRWDKPPEKNQIDKMRNKLFHNGKDIVENFKKDATGEDIYKTLSTVFGSDKDASMFLLKAGIDGMKYPTGMLSGIKGSKTFNYVVYNPEAVTIERMVE